jgi:hypothetical protein
MKVYYPQIIVFHVFFFVLSVKLDAQISDRIPFFLLYVQLKRETS